MLKNLLLASAIVAIPSLPALAQSLPAMVTLKLTSQQVITVATGLAELQYKTAAPVLAVIQAQINQQQPKPKLAPAPVIVPPVHTVPQAPGVKK